MIKATVTLAARAGKHLGDTAITGRDWQDAVRNTIRGLRIEVFPYWNIGELVMTWEASDPQLDAALYGVAAMCGWLQSGFEEHV